MNTDRSNAGSYGLVTICTSAYLYLFVRVLWRIGDEGLFVNGAALVAHGAVPYRDFFETAGPGSFYWLGFFFWIFGTSLLVARGLVLCTFVGTALLILWMTRRLYRGPFQMLPTVSYVVIAFPMWPVTNHHWDSNLSALLSMAAIMMWQDNRRDARLFLAGTLAGLTSCFLQQKGLLMLVAIALVVAATGRQSGEGGLFRRLALVVGGYLVVLALVVVAFLANGSLSQLVYATFLWPLANYSEVNSVPYGYGLFEWFLGLMWKPLLDPWLPASVSMTTIAMLMLPYAVIAGLPLLCVAVAGLTFANRLAREHLFGVRAWPYWTGGIGLYLSELHRRDIVHLIYGAPLLLILLFVAWSNWCGTVSRLRQATVGVFMACVTVLAVFQGLVATAATYETETRRGRAYSFRKDDALQFLLEHLQPGDLAFIYPYYPMYYFLADIVNPTRHSILMYGINTESQFASVISDLDRQQVKWVLCDSRLYGPGLRTWFPNYRPPAENAMALEQYLEREYETIGVANDFKILQRRAQASGTDPAATERTRTSEIRPFAR